MRFAQHLAVLDICGIAIAPVGNVIGIHFGLLSDAGDVGFAFDGAKKAIALVERFGFKDLQYNGWVCVINNK